MKKESLQHCITKCICLLYNRCTYPVYTWWIHAMENSVIHCFWYPHALYSCFLQCHVMLDRNTAVYIRGATPSPRRRVSTMPCFALYTLFVEPRLLREGVAPRSRGEKVKVLIFRAPKEERERSRLDYYKVDHGIY